MKKKYYFLLCLYCLPLCAFAQSDQHYTMFMFDKLLYNPGYTGSRDVTSINVQNRLQWLGLGGHEGVRSANISVDGPIGTYMKPFRKIAIGLSVSREETNVQVNTDFRAYYAYRIKLKNSVLSLGLSGGANLYTARYDHLILYDPQDPNFTGEIINAAQPNFGTGAYWSGDKFFCGLSVPNLLQNQYDAKEAKTSSRPAQQVRGYYLSGGYVFPINDIITLKPQAIVRFAGNGYYRLPVNCDINLSATAYDRIMAGITYRTDNSLEFIIHMQVSVRFNVGYAYDYLMSDLGPYAKGAHELVLGYDFNHERLKFTAPRFSKEF